MNNHQWVARLLKLKPHTVAEVAEKLDISHNNAWYHIKKFEDRLEVSNKFTINSRMLPYVVKQYSIKPDEQKE